MAAAIPRSRRACAICFGEEVEVLCVKGPGGDMARSSRRASSAVRLEPMRKLRARDAISDEDMVAIQRANLIDPTAPNPSVEMLLHAFLPHKFIDHTHATAVLSLIDQPDGETKCGEVFGGRMGFVPYVMPGFGLAKKAIEVFERAQPSDGLILRKHGIVTFGDTAREAYERMIEMVSLAEDFIARHRKPSAVAAAAAAPRRASRMSRRSCAAPAASRTRRSKAPGAGSCSNSAPATRSAISSTPKTWTALQPSRRRHARSHHPHQELAAGLAAAGERQARRFARRRPASGRRIRRALSAPISRATTSAPAASSASSIPCRASCWCPASACSGSAARKATPIIAADIAEAWIEGVTDAEAIGRFESISEADMFDCEYWSLEQAKLGKRGKSCRSPARSPPSPAPAAPSARPPPSLRRRRRRSRAARRRIQPRPRRRPKRSARPRCRSPAT